MTKLSVEMLLEASKPGGAGALSSVTRLAPAGGEHSLVAPAKYASEIKGHMFLRRAKLTVGPQKRF